MNDIFLATTSLVEQDIKFCRCLSRSIVVIFHNPETEKCGQKKNRKFMKLSQILEPQLIRNICSSFLGTVSSQERNPGAPSEDLPNWRRVPGFPVYGVGQPTEAGFAKIPEKVFSSFLEMCFHRCILSSLRLARRKQSGSTAARSRLHMSTEFQSLQGDRSPPLACVQLLYGDFDKNEFSLMIL